MSIANILLYCLFMTGLLLISGPAINNCVNLIKLKKRLGKSPVENQKSMIYRWMEMLLTANSKSSKEVDPNSFITFLFMVFLLVFLVCLKSLRFLFAFAAASMVTSLPVLFLYARMESKRTQNSKEGISMVTEFYRQYKMKNLNVYEALEATIAADGDYPGCRKELYKLLLKLRSCANQTDIRRSLDDFSFALGTVWGRMFSTCLRLAAERGDDVSEGLADIVVQLKTADQNAEERKRLNGEAARMTMFLVPILYVGTMLLAIYYLDVSPGKLLKNQFFTAEGIVFFLGTVFLFAFNMILLKLIDNTKIDY